MQLIGSSQTATVEERKNVSRNIYQSNCKVYNVQSTGKPGGEAILYCGAFQKDACSHTKDHEGLLRGESRMLKHICAHCWLSEKKFASHSQASCPSKTKEED